MPARGKILYIGDDADFCIQLNAFFCPKSKYIDVEAVPYVKKNIIKRCPDMLRIIFVDFSCPTLDVGPLIQEIHFIKRISTFKSILLVALFKDEQQRNNFAFLLTSGFQFIHIKGTETDTIFRDSYYSGFYKTIDFPVLAKAKDIDKDLAIGICSTLTVMNNEEFSIETDIDGFEEYLSLSMPMFPDLKKTTFEIKEHRKFANLFPMSCAYTLGYPFPSAWEEESEETIHPDTLETWLDINSQEFENNPKIPIKVVSRNFNLLIDCFDELDESLIIEFRDDLKDLEEETFSKKPALIFIDLEDEGDEAKLNLSSLDFLQSGILHIENYSPIVIVTNCNSTSLALQKTYNYNLLTATGEKLTPQMFLSLVKKFQEKNKQNFSNLPNFKISSTHRQIDLKLSVRITSLTEHELTFLSQHEIPLFSVIHISLPIEFYATIIPPFNKFEKIGGKNQYVAFIHGLSEKELMTLRKLVNQLIYNPPEELTLESIKALIMNSTQAPVKQVEVKDENLEASIKTKNVSNEIDIKYRSLGKSKL